MRYRKFNAQNTGRYHRLTPTMTFHRRGRATINGEAQRLLSPDRSLQAIEFIQDAERPKDWYIRAASTNEGFILRSNSRGGRSKKISAIRFVNHVMDTLEITTDVVYYRVATQPSIIEDEEWFAILTANSIKK